MALRDLLLQLETVSKQALQSGDRKTALGNNAYLDYSHSILSETKANW